MEKFERGSRRLGEIGRAERKRRRLAKIMSALMLMSAILGRTDADEPAEPPEIAIPAGAGYRFVADPGTSGSVPAVVSCLDELKAMGGLAAYLVGVMLDEQVQIQLLKDKDTYTAAYWRATNTYYQGVSDLETYKYARNDIRELALHEMLHCDYFGKGADGGSINDFIAAQPRQERSNAKWLEEKIVSIVAELASGGLPPEYLDDNPWEASRAAPKSSAGERALSDRIVAEFRAGAVDAFTGSLMRRMLNAGFAHDPLIWTEASEAAVSGHLRRFNERYSRFGYSIDIAYVLGILPEVYDATNGTPDENSARAAEMRATSAAPLGGGEKCSR